MRLRYGGKQAIPGGTLDMPVREPPYQVRRTWKGDEGIQQCQPLRWYMPETLEEVVAIVRIAEREGCRVKAVGTGQSYSDAVLTTDFLVDTQKLRAIRPVPAGEALVEVEAGVRVRELNRYLEGRGRALQIMASSDGLTFVGSAMTGSHGSAPQLGAVASQIRSLLLVTGGGEALRIEPSSGPSREAEPGVELRKDDTLFDAAAVNVGTLGVVVSVWVETVPAYLLREVRTLHPWPELRARLADGSLLRDHHWVEIWLNPHPVGGERHALLTVRDRTDRPARGASARRRHLPALLAGVPFLSRLMLWWLRHSPQTSGWVVQQALEALVDDAFVGPPGEVLIDILAPNGFANELHFPRKDGRYLQAIDTYFELAQKYRLLGERYMNLLTVRFIAPTTHHLSMNYGEDTVSVELPTLTDWIGSRDLFDHVQRRMIELGGRPHWALEFDTLSDAGGLVRAMYPQYEVFAEVRRRLDPKDTFANRFTDRIGLTTPSFGR
jgi:FAD/FMN-containing dehydrogenase